MKSAARHLLVAGLAAVLLPASGAAVHAGSAHNSPKGTYAASGSTGCLTASGGFNSLGQPINPAASSVSSTGSSGLWVFDGHGNGTHSSTNVNNSSAASTAGTSIVPSASTSTTSSNFTYTVASDGTVTVSVIGETGNVVDGPRGGQSFTIDQFVLVGNLALQGKALSLSTPQDAVETITYSDNTSLPRICHRSAMLIQISP